MQRVVIIGNAGTGKSTLARELGRRLDLPVIHLDALYWKPGWVESQAPEFRDRVVAAHAGDRWISEGNYSAKTFDLRLPRADTVIWLRRWRWLCLWRTIRRGLTQLGQTRPDMAPGCPERFNLAFCRFVLDFERRSSAKFEQASREAAGHARVMQLDNDTDVRRFLAGLPENSAS